MSGPINIYHQVNVIIAACSAFFLVGGMIAVQDACYTARDIRRWWRRRSRPNPAARTPSAEIGRQSLRTNDPWMDPHMPDESEIRRYGRGVPSDSAYGPRHIEPAHTQPAAQPVPAWTSADNPGQRRPRPDRRGILIGVLAFVCTLLVVTLAGGGYVAYTKLAAGPGTFDAQGTLILRVSDPYSDGIDNNGGPCTGASGYADITQGTSVVVRDAKGTTVATGELEAGNYGTNSCVFPFRVTRIPGGSKFYSFEVSHRGQVTMDRLSARFPQLTLGS